MQYKYDVLTSNPKTSAIEFQVWSGIFETARAMEEWYELYGCVHEREHELFKMFRRKKGMWKLFGDTITPLEFLKALKIGVIR